MRHEALSSAVSALGRRRLVMAVPLLGGLAWAWSGCAAALEAAPGAVQGVVLRDRQTLLGTAVDIVVQGLDTAELRQAVDQAFARMQALQALLGGDIDLLGSANGYDAATAGVVLSRPYAEDQPVLVTRVSETRALDTGLKGLRLSMVAHYLPLAEVRATYPNARLQTYGAYYNALNAVAFDQADVFLGDTLSTHYQINQGYLKNLKMVNFGKHEPVGFSFALRADKDPYEALESLKDFSVTYQAATDEPLPLFRRR